MSFLTCFCPWSDLNKAFVLLYNDNIVAFREVVAELKAAGASWIQFDEPTLVLDLDSTKLQAFTKAYSELESSFSGLNVLIVSYFADVPAEAYKLVRSHDFVW